MSNDREVPVYLFTGLLESGKTSFIRDTLNDRGFHRGEKTLVILCEEGIEEYDEAEFVKKNIYFEHVEEREDLTKEFYHKCEEFHKPERVLIEYNGMWDMDGVDEDLMPEDWVLAQVISTVDATTYDSYWANMKSLMIQQLSLSDMIIMNRCTDKTRRSDFRRAVKTFNKKAQIGYEAAAGFENALKEEELPYDLNADVIEIENDDFGIFYMDAMDNPKKYDGKVVKFLAQAYNPPKFPSNCFVPGRFAMTCCADDIQFMGILCKNKSGSDVHFEDREWICVEAKIKREFVKEYRGKGPVLYLQAASKAEKPEDELIYF